MGGIRRSGPEHGGGPVTGFGVRELTGAVDTLVRPEPPLDGERRAYLVRPDAAAVVLGSAQAGGAVDRGRCAAEGLAVVQRRSGGGAVVVVPGAQVWLDVFVPAGDRLADSDVARAATWLGELWAEALGRSGVAGPLAVHRGGLVPSPFARTACFSGLGPGEVTLAGRKVVGCSQRRTRVGTWLHTMALLDNHQGALARLLVLDPAEQSALAAALAGAVGVVPVAAAALEASLAELLEAR